MMWFYGVQHISIPIALGETPGLVKEGESGEFSFRQIAKNIHNIYHRGENVENYHGVCD
jgi:hypothetical protein